jgi:7-hydroxymethyl chlorophyll a reductase
MGVPYNGSPMASHPQYITLRNSRGREMLDVLSAGELTRTPPVDTGDRRPLVMQVRVCVCGQGRGGQCLCLASLAPTAHAPPNAPCCQTVEADDEAKLGRFRDPAPLWLGRLLAWVLNLVGPKGLEFAKYR